ncbi:MAG: two-component system cell cycle sensor histidine kinase/response regulator CckA, partial [Kiritimatiellia bacterium]
GIGYFLPESRRLISEAMRNAVERGDGYDLVLETLTIKGRRIDVRTTCEVTMRDGRAVMLTGTFQDITEREAAKSVMLQSKQKLATAMSLTQMADWEFDLESGAFHFNDRAYVLFGTSAAKEGGYEMPAETFLRQFCHPNDAAYVGEHITRAISNPPEGTQTLEYRLIRRDDGALQHMVAHYQVQAGELGRGVWAVGSVLDVTARKRAQLAHVESENQLRVVIDSAMDAIVILDGSQNIVLFNAAAERMFGFAAAEMLGQPLDRLIPASRREAHHGHIDRMAVTPIMGVTMGRMRDEITALRADGTDFPIEVSISTIYSGETPLYVGVARDITVRKRDEAERLAMEVHLQQAQRLDSIGQLAGGVAHDFNNMLNVILVTAELALENVSPGDELHGDLIEILTAAQRSAGLTRQLLAFARQEAIAPKVLNLNSTIEGMLSMLRKVIGEDLQLIWAPETMLGHVMMDPSQVDQILVNLCLNARDSIAGVGSVSISTSMVTLDEATFHGETTSISGLFVRLTVSDTGSGMDTSTLQRIFEPFFTTKDTGQGTGLGLSTVYGIVKQNGGAIDVISSPGAGAAFSVFLPPIDASERKSGSGVAPGSSPSGGETLLIVDDEQAMLAVCKRVLVAYGHKVLTASTPAEAMRLAEKHADELSLLIIDVIMPKMTGRELSDLLMSRVPHLKCLFMSGYTADIIATRGVLEPDVAFIQKPFSPDVLAARVRGVLDRQA